MNFFIFSHSERNADDGAPLLIARSLSVHTQREGGRLTTGRVFGLAGRTALYSAQKRMHPSNYCCTMVSEAGGTTIISLISPGRRTKLEKYHDTRVARSAAYRWG